MYKEYLIHLASHGYLTVGLDFASQGFTTESEHDLKAQQALDVIAALQTMNTIYASLPVIAAGHSQGGKIAFYSASMDTSGSILGVIAMDPVNAGGPPCFLYPSLCGKYPVAPNPQAGERGVVYQMNKRSIIFRSAPDFLTNPDEDFNAH
jgi:pimeloyl-ACP methyl ester carboxylesterase